MVDPTSRDISGLSTAVAGTDQAYTTSNYLCKGKFGNGIARDEATTNIIPNSSVNSYPITGNAWGTYNTNQYNNNVYFSIGTIDNITDNIVTLATVSHAIYTYDVLRPQTTGGGVVAGTNYFIKKLSTNSFTIHAYDNSQDGSKGYTVHNNIKNDVRITLTSTDFPTMWIGTAHVPNSALVKEIIPKGFKGIHDCIRCHGEHKPEGEQDYMAYGVNPQVTSGVTYCISFWTRAVTTSTIGKSINLTAYTNANWTLTRTEGMYTYTDLEWHKCTFRGVAPNTGGTGLYFPFGKCGTIDIAEIQVEAKSYSTQLAVPSRTETYLQYQNYPVRTVSLWIKSTSNKIVDGVNTPRTILRQVDINDLYPQWSLYIANTNTSDCLPGTATPITAGSAVLKVKWKTDGTNVTSYLCTVNGANIIDGKWHHITCQLGISSICRIWVDGTFSDSLVIPESNYVFGGLIHVGYDSTSDVNGNFIIDELRLDQKTYNSDDIIRRSISETEYYNPYSYGITCS
jgi:hypothetical protein